MGADMNANVKVTEQDVIDEKAIAGLMQELMEEGMTTHPRAELGRPTLLRTMELLHRCQDERDRTAVYRLLAAEVRYINGEAEASEARAKSLTTHQSKL
tara:strand:- start:13 stop:309 length:297 start_codon:yes stop_codon:yes gene_type:complete